MSEQPEKKTTHNLIVRLLSESPITYDAALFQLAKAIDRDQLEDNDLILVGFDFTGVPDAEKQKDKETGTSKLAQLAARSPGAIGDFLALFKGKSPRDLYIMFCGVVLGSILLYKWIIRLVTGTF
jgi:hypothetical protein